MSTAVIRLVRFVDDKLLVTVGKTDRIREIRLTPAEQAELLRDLAEHAMRRELGRG